MMFDVMEFKNDLLQRLTAGVDELVDDHAQIVAMDPAALASQMLAVVPKSHVYDELIGPFHTADSIRSLLGGSSRQAVFDRVKRGTVLQVTTSDGVKLYPAFQFDGHQVAPGMKAVLAEFRDTPVDGWTVAAWLSVPTEDLEGQSPRDWLADPERDVQPVIELARSTSLRWSMP